MTKLDRLQQYLPFTVLKRTTFFNEEALIRGLQQYLPFTVLKLILTDASFKSQLIVATVLTVYGIETYRDLYNDIRYTSCNSTYRLRY